jgi:phosphomannomutase
MVVREHDLCGNIDPKVLESACDIAIAAVDQQCAPVIAQDPDVDRAMMNVQIPCQAGPWAHISALPVRQRAIEPM